MLRIARMTETGISVVIPTSGTSRRNLLRLFRALEQQKCKCRFEIIVVEEPWAEVPQGLLPEGTRVVHKSWHKPGLNSSRNLGLQESQLPFVAYLDDDCVPDRIWLWRLYIGLRKNRAAAIGGPVLPRFQEPPGDVLVSVSNKFNPLSLMHNNATQPIWVDYLLGCNMAFRKDALHRIGGFDPDLDRHPGDLLSYGETDVFNRIRENCMRILYDPLARVWHQIGLNRLNLKWAVRRMVWQGVSVRYAYSKYRSRDNGLSDLLVDQTVFDDPIAGVAQLTGTGLSFLRKNDTDSLGHFLYVLGSCLERFANARKHPSVVDASAHLAWLLLRRRILLAKES